MASGSRGRIYSRFAFGTKRNCYIEREYLFLKLLNRISLFSLIRVQLQLEVRNYARGFGLDITSAQAKSAKLHQHGKNLALIDCSRPSGRAWLCVCVRGCVVALPSGIVDRLCISSLFVHVLGIA
jgi:hypothetical protein